MVMSVLNEIISVRNLPLWDSSTPRQGAIDRKLYTLNIPIFTQKNKEKLCNKSIIYTVFRAGRVRVHPGHPKPCKQAFRIFAFFFMEPGHKEPGHHA